MEPEERSTNRRQDGNSSIVPHKQGILSKGDQSLPNGVGEGRHKVPVAGDERAHVPGSLGECILETGDRGEDLGETNKHVGDGLHPDSDGGLFFARVHVFAARALLIDVVLDDCGGNHGEGSHGESDGHALDGGEADAGLAEGGVEEIVDNGDEDDEGDGVEIGDDIVGNTAEFHGGGLRRQVVVHLVVGDPIERNPGEARAGTQTTSNLVNPCIIKDHPLGLTRAELAGFDILPEILRLEVLTGLDWVDRPLAFQGKQKKLKGAGNDRSGGRSAVVLVTADIEDDGAETKHEGRKKEGAPETDISLNVYHADLASQRTSVDHQVEVEEDTRERDVGVGNGALAGLGIDDHTQFGLLILLRDQGRDVGLESTGSKPKANDTNDEGSNSMAASKDGRQGGDDENDVTENGDENGNEDGVVTAEILVSDIGAKNGRGICPELVD